MKGADAHMSLSPDHELDGLFSQARALSLEDHGAAERFLSQHRSRQARNRRQTGWLSALLACAALVAGLSVLRPTSAELPSSAAYDAYHVALGDEW